MQKEEEKRLLWIATFKGIMIHGQSNNSVESIYTSNYEEWRKIHFLWFSANSLSFLGQILQSIHWNNWISWTDKLLDAITNKCNSICLINLIQLSSTIYDSAQHTHKLNTLKRFFFYRKPDLVTSIYFCHMWFCRRIKMWINHVWKTVECRIEHFFVDWKFMGIFTYDSHWFLKFSSGETEITSSKQQYWKWSSDFRCARAR